MGRFFNTAIETPEEPTFYYEHSSSASRLFFNISIYVLEEAVENWGVNKNILIDYPDGIDIEVTQENIDSFREEYGLTINIDIETVLSNFRIFVTTLKSHICHSGYIDRKILGV